MRIAQVAPLFESVAPKYYAHEYGQVYEGLVNGKQNKRLEVWA